MPQLYWVTDVYIQIIFSGIDNETIPPKYFQDSWSEKIMSTTDPLSLQTTKTKAEN